MMEILHTSTTFFSDLGMFLFNQTANNLNAVMVGFRSGGIDAMYALIPLVILVVQFSLLLFALRVIQMVFVLSRETHIIWDKPKQYSVHREGGKHVLVIGDSTAYGTGAARPEDTIAGRLGHDFPRTDILNTAVNGSRTKDAIEQLHRAGPEKFDLIIIGTGGNDIWHFTKLPALEQDLTRLLQEASEKSNHRVILLFYANFGSAGVFPGIIRSLLKKRTDQVHAVFKGVARRLDVPLVEIYTDDDDRRFSENPFTADPERYFAKDRMHPNSEGYRLWYNRMWSEMVARNFTFSEDIPGL